MVELRITVGKDAILSIARIRLIADKPQQPWIVLGDLGERRLIRRVPIVGEPDDLHIFTPGWMWGLRRCSPVHVPSGVEQAHVVVIDVGDHPETEALIVRWVELDRVLRYAWERRPPNNEVDEDEGQQNCRFQGADSGWINPMLVVSHLSGPQQLYHQSPDWAITRYTGPSLESW